MAKKRKIHPNSLQNLKQNQFTSENQPANKGRKKRIYTILKEKGYSKEDVRTAFGELAWYTLQELKDVYKDDNKPIIVRIVSNQFFQALNKNDWSRIKEIMEYIIGKPIQDVYLGDMENKDEITITYDDVNES